ncbi:uncharacterized protein [Littorina saxatilis]|uniref:uncharacterized protein n=1 Tax=Littorina saxatilis TaxID=31220 RepID=UPI0038B598AB
MYKDLGDIEKGLRSIGSGETIQESWDDVQRTVQNIMFDIDRALDRQTTSVQVAKEPTSRHSSVTPSVGSSTHKSASGKTASHKAASITSAIHKSASHKSGSRRSGSQVASRAESLRSKSVSSEDTKLALKLEAASLAIKVEAIGIGTGAAVIADQGTHQPSLDATSVPVCQAAVIADQRTHQPAMDFTSVPVCQAASTHDISTVNVNAAVTNFVAGTTTTEPRQHALPVVDLVVGVSASTSAATTNNATYEAYGPQRREDVNAPHHAGTSAPFIHREPSTPNYTTAATTSSMRPTALLTTLQHPLGAYTGQPPLHNVGHSTTSVTGPRPPDLDHTEPYLLRMSEKQGSPEPSMKYSGLRVRSPTSSEFVRLPSAISRPYLSVDPTQIPTSETVKVYPHLQHLSPKLPPLYPDCEAGLLIGYDCAEALMPLNVVQGLPFAVETKLGWSIVGKSPHSVAFDGVGSSMHVVVKPGSRQEESAAHVYKIQVDEVSCTDLLHVMERDFADSDTGSMSQDDLKFMKIVKENVKVNEAGHYEMPLPFRPEQPSLPDNRGAAVKRLMGLKRQFEKKPGYREDYIKFMNVILERGDAELIPKNEVEVPNRWYIPHHGVYNDKKPGKIRVVFDCSARHLGTSLNDLLLQGPDLISSLSGVLCRFRKGPIAFSCDVEKMYHQFHVSEPHRDFLRFLWWKDGDTSGQPLDYRMKVHIFGATSSPGCANFGLKQVAKDNATISAKASAFLQRDFYVDDGLQAKDSVEEAADVLMKAREICEHGQLRLHKIVSNSKELLEYFPDSEVTSTKATELAVPCSTPEIERTLGLHWCTDDDTLGFTDNPRLGPLNRRGVLSTIASVYDPLGFLAPFLLTGKLILQELCRQELGWDDPLPPSLQERWEEWLKDLSRLGCVKVPRNYLPTDFGTVKNVELHHFSDASTAGYGQCSYLRFENHLGNIHSTLVVAKARVAPLRHVTVPRLELTAAVLSVKMARFLQEELDFESIEHFFWTDSMIVLAYLKNESKRFHVFVANRVQQIRQFSQASQWNHVSTKENPADYASRGLSVSDLMTSEWFHGPAFLSQSLPESDDFFEIPDDDVEVKVCKATTSKEVSVQSFEQIAQRFSCKTSLIRAMAVLVRKCNAIKGHQSSPLEVLEVTEKKFIVCLQKEHFERPTPSLRNQLQALNAHKDVDGILRVYGRSQNSSSSSADKFPILLPRDSHFSSLVAQDCHAAIAHQGRMFTINQVRASGFWIIGIRHVVSSLVRRCVHCRWHRSGPAGQKMADLPLERLDPSPPFTYCGIDCFGPFHVKDGRREVKRYGLIVTCFASRAIHIETLDDMSSDSFINALRIVVSMRGNISRIWCDKGTNFVGACNEFKLAWKEMDSERLTSKMLESKCEFKFNPPAASHMGGVWERQIRTIRSILNGLLRRSGQRLTTSSLRTFLYEVMAIVNSRPLSVESLESADGPRPLTPNHVLTMKSGAILPPPGVFEDPDLYQIVNFSKRGRLMKLCIISETLVRQRMATDNIGHRGGI